MFSVMEQHDSLLLLSLRWHREEESQTSKKGELLGEPYSVADEIRY